MRVCRPSGVAQRGVQGAVLMKEHFKVHSKPPQMFLAYKPDPTILQPGLGSVKWFFYCSQLEGYSILKGLPERLGLAGLFPHGLTSPVKPLRAQQLDSKEGIPQRPATVCTRVLSILFRLTCQCPLDRDVVHEGTVQG